MFIHSPLALVLFVAVPLLLTCPLSFPSPTSSSLHQRALPIQPHHPHAFSHPFPMSTLIKQRTRFFLNEPLTALRLIEILINSHLVLQDSTTPLFDRSLPNTIGKNLALLLIKFLYAHSNIPNNKLMHLLKTGFTLASPPSSQPASPSNPDSIYCDENQASATTDDRSGTDLARNDGSATETATPSPPLASSPKPVQLSSQSVQAKPASAAQFACQSCTIDFASVVLYRTHLRSPEHQQKLREKSSAPTAVQPVAQEAEAKLTNPEDTLAKHTPTLLSFASNTKDDEIDNTKAKLAAQAQHNAIHTSSHVYHQHERDDGVLDFKYGGKNQDEEEEESLLLPSASTRKGKRNSLNSSKPNSRNSSVTRSHSPKQRCNSGSQNRSNNTIAKAKQTGESDDCNSGNDNDDDDNDDDDDDVCDAQNDAFDPLGLGRNANNNNNNNGRIPSKPGTQIQLVAIPLTTPRDQSDQDCETATEIKKNNNYQNDQSGPKVVQLSKHSHPQHIILTSPSIGSLVIPASVSTISSIQTSNQNEDRTAQSDENIGSTLAQITTRQLPFLQALLWQFLSTVSQTTPIKSFPSQNINVMPSNLTAIIFDSGGKFAFSLMLGNIVLYHTSFANYTTRKKQGKQQSAHDKNGGHANSVGASIRRQQTLRHRERIRETLYHLRAELFYCNQILLYVPSHHMKEQLFMNQEQLSKWALSGGSWIGSASLPLPQYTTLQLKNQQTNQPVTQYGQSPFNLEPQQSLERNDEQIQMSSNFAFFSTHRDNFENLPGHPNPTNFPPTRPMQLPNFHAFFQQKYTLALNHLQSAQNQKTINQQTGQYQMMYFSKMNKKHNAKQNQQLREVNFDDDSDADDDNDVDHNITADWHKETLMYYLNQQVERGTTSTSISPSQPISLTNQVNSQSIYVDQFVTTQSAAQYATHEYTIDPTGIYPPTITQSLQLPKAHNTPQHHTSLPYILSHLQTTTASIQPITYNIRPYHPHFYKANHTQQQQEHLYLLHPYDPRISYLGVNIHDAKHHEVLRLFQDLMLCKIKPHTPITE